MYMFQINVGSDLYKIDTSILEAPIHSEAINETLPCKAVPDFAPSSGANKNSGCRVFTYFFTIGYLKAHIYIIHVYIHT